MTIVDIPGGSTIVLDPILSPPPDVTNGNVQLIPWGDIFNDLKANLEDWLGLDTGMGGVDNTDTIIPNIITALHYNNRSISVLQNNVLWLDAYVKNTEDFAEATHRTLVTWMQDIQAEIDGIRNGTLPVVAPVPQAVLDQIQQQVNALVVPLQENLGQITTQLQVLQGQVTALQQQHQRENLDARMTSMETWISNNLVPLLVPLAALAGANIITRLATDEACCADNNDFRNEFQSLLKALKPLLEALKALQALDLVALAAAIFAEGLPGAAREIGHLVESHFASAEGDIASFLGL